MGARVLRNAIGFASLALGAFALTASPALAQQQQDTSQQSTGDAVADAARKAREEKKKDTPKPKKVYTDDDLNHSTSGNVPPSSGASGASTQQGSGKDADAKSKNPDGKTNPEESAEARWRKQFKDAYASLDRAEKELSILEREDSKAQLQYYPDPQKALAEQYTRKDINEKDAKITAKKKEIEQIKQRIDDMEDALRKSGGDPGWAAP
jgi:hypothetical protein